MAQKTRVLVVEDEAIVATDIRKILDNLGYEVVGTASSGKTAIQKAKENKPDLVLMDIVLKGKMDGIEAAEQIRQRFNIPVVYLTAYADNQILKRAKVTEPFGYIVKPFEDRELKSVIEMALYKARIENELKASRASFHNIVEKSADGIVIVDEDGIVQFVNHTAEILFGRKAEEFVGEQFGLPVVAGDVIELDIIRQGREPGIAEMRVVQTEWNDQKAYLALLRDITERRRAEEKIKQAAHEWSVTFDSITDMVSVHDENFKFVKVNKALAETFGTEPEKLIGKTCYEVFHNAKQPCPDCPHAQTLKTEKPAKLELLESRLGVYFGISTWPMFDEHDRVKSSVHIVKNITEQKEAEERLKETMKMKSDFTSMVSHELRTPLTAIKEGIALVVDGLAGEINEEQKELLDISKRNVDRLARLINDVLDFQKLGAGRMKFDIQPNDINKIARDIYEMMVPTMADIGVDLLLELDGGLPKAGFDKDKIIQVLTNLVTNAAKFTEKGRITIKTAQKDNNIEVSVSDTGMGIRKKDMPRVFGEFEQLGHGGERKTGGTGLGLTISKELIEKHNGTIWVESEYEKGTKFTFTLPIHSREELFNNYINNGIEEASKNNTKMSLILISIADFDKLKHQLPDEKIHSTLDEMETILENGLRRGQSSSHQASDAVFKLSSEVFVVLANCGKENTQRVSERLEQKLDDYLAGENLADKIKLLLGYATYPDDAITSDKLIKKAKELRPMVTAELSM